MRRPRSPAPARARDRQETPRPRQSRSGEGQRYDEQHEVMEPDDRRQGQCGDDREGKRSSILAFSACRVPHTDEQPEPDQPLKCAGGT